MAKSTGRHHFPCRECGKAHTNPFSSSLCVPCGADYHSKNLADKHEKIIAKKADYDTVQLEGNDSFIVHQLRSNCDLSMNDSAKFLKAFRICMENING
jgi:hypothetical protein